MFNLQSPISVQQGRGVVQVEDVLNHVFPLLTPDRQRKINQVAAIRCQRVSVVVENLYDRGNISAVMRSAEGLGFLDFHVIEGSEKFKEANRVTQGADKWLSVTKWKSTSEAIKEFKKNKVKIIATCLEGAKPINEIDFSGPCAIVLGNEKDGISREMFEMADERAIIPMPGFVQSFNISIAAALLLYHITQKKNELKESLPDLTEEQMNIVKAYYAIRSLDTAEDVLKAKGCVQLPL